MHPNANRALRLPHQPALDGVRALAVAAVFLYHTRFPWAAGGFLGVESFFVISGFLITSLLVREWLAAGRIDIGAFWLRRARRLLPAMWALLLAAPILAAQLAPSALPRLAEDTLAALAYVTNWAYIVREIPYFEQYAQPPLLQHLWSLAVEEQFYLVWPLVMVVALRGLKIASLRDARRLVVGFALTALASTLWMAALQDPAGDASRVYFGTDTRAAAFLVGAVLAAAWQPVARKTRGWERRTGMWGGWAALALLIVAYVGLDEFQPWLYRGGFLAIAALTAVVIRLVLIPGASIAATLGSRPAVWLGARSYGLYLWHWPVIVLTAPLLAAAPWVLAVGVQALASLALAELSYRWIEGPIRSRGFKAWGADLWAAGRALPGQARYALGAVAIGASLLPAAAFTQPAEAEPAQAVVVALEASPTAGPLPTLAAGSTPTRVATLVAAGPTQAVADLAFATDPSPIASTEVAQTDITLADVDLTRVEPTLPEPTSPVVEPTAAPMQPAVEPTLAAPLPTEPAPVVAGPSGIAVTLIGDSVMLGAEKALANRLGTDVHIDAVVGRRMGDLFATLDDLAAHGRLASTVVVHLGSNQPYEGAVFDAVMAHLTTHGVQRVIFVNVRRPARWVEGINWRMAEGVARYPQAQLIDWFALSNANDGWFIPDGTHLTGTGIGWYVDAIATALES